VPFLRTGKIGGLILTLFIYGNLRLKRTYKVRVRVRVTLQLTVSQSVCLGVEPNLGLLARDFFFFKVTVLSFLGRPL
jgi:hypothetical protein